MELPPRSEWERRTAAAYNAIAHWVDINDHPLTPNDCIIMVRSLMGENPSTLDLGCGSGRATPILKGFGISRIVGVDFSEELIRIAKGRYPEVDFRVGDILRLTDVVGSEKFDAFWAIACLMHILPENMPQALMSIRQVLNPGAIGFVTTPFGDEETILDASSFKTSGGIIPPGHLMFRCLWDSGGIAAQFKNAGFAVIAPSFHDGYMINMTVQAV